MAKKAAGKKTGEKKAGDKKADKKAVDKVGGDVTGRWTRTDLEHLRDEFVDWWVQLAAGQGGAKRSASGVVESSHPACPARRVLELLGWLLDDDPLHVDSWHPFRYEGDKCGGWISVGSPSKCGSSPEVVQPLRPVKPSPGKRRRGR